jgi:hypothetical protein
LVDITRCERCGKVIPALDTGCAWCDARDAEERGFDEKTYLPLAIRMLLWMFVANLALTGLMAVLTLASHPGAGGPLVAVLASMRLLLAGATLVGILFREPWGRWLPFSFLGFEAVCFVATSAGWLFGAWWIGSWIAPLWNLLFAFLFIREDVRARLDPKVADRKEVGALLEDIRRDRR